MPSTENQERQYAQEIIGKRTYRGRIQYEVRWEDDSTSFEDFASIKDDLKEMIREFNQKKKDK
jgi:hypothetical protein